jgi:predicted nuclease with TOPRIM domain
MAEEILSILHFLKSMQAISENFKERLDRLTQEDKESQAKTNELLATYRELINKLEALSFDN